MHTTGTIAAALGAELVGPSDRPIRGLGTLDGAGPEELTFIRSAAFAAEWRSSRAGAAIVSRGLEVPGHDSAARALLVVPDADMALTKALGLFAPPASRPAPGVHPSALVDVSARVGAGASIGPMCVVEAGATIGDGAVLVSQVFVGAGATVGAGTTLHAHVSIGERCVVGRQCLLHPGVVIGADGFGFVSSPDGRGLQKVPHIGTVEIGDQVEIGANSCVDRAKFGSTTVGSGTKIDNLVQVGHNVRIGRLCLVMAQVGIAGSVRVGDGCVLAGQVGVSGHHVIGDGARLAAQAGVFGDIPAGETWSGYPARPHREALRAQAALFKLPGMIRRLERLIAGDGGSE